MRVTELPFNAFIGLDDARAAEGLLVTLPGHAQYQNHVGTVHASALMAVAEAASGAWLLQTLQHVPGAVPLVRNFSSQFRKPAKGAVHGRSTTSKEEAALWRESLAEGKRVVAPVSVDVVDEAGTIVMSAVVEWVVPTNHKTG